MNKPLNVSRPQFYLNFAKLSPAPDEAPDALEPIKTANNERERLRLYEYEASYPTIAAQTQTHS